MNTMLSTIIDHKIQEVRARQAVLPLASLRDQCQGMPPTRGFLAALKDTMIQHRPAVIAELKKASPSKGIIRRDYRPTEIAVSYELGGASCLSVLTETAFFFGQDTDLVQARDACTLPVLRKDFTVDPYQIYEARVLGADCILLIMAALDDVQLIDLNGLAMELGLDVVVEVHNIDELERALQAPAPMIGINNRNLQTFAVDLQTTLQLRKSVPRDRLIVTESGISTVNDVRAMRDCGVHAFLVGERLMRSPEPGLALHELFFSE